MKKIIYNVASFNREKTLIKAIESIFDQSDIINVALNNYSHIPVELYDKKIRIFRTDNSKGDAFKFIELQNSDGYFFTIDDDIKYPPNYSKFMIDKVREYSGKKIITLHGRNFKEFPIDSYCTSPADYYHFLNDVNDDVKVQIGGTGVMCFDTNLFKISIDYFKHPNMADIWIGKYARENNIDIIVAAHKKGFLENLGADDTIYSSLRRTDKLQTEIINLNYGKSQNKKNKIAICIPIYQRHEICRFVLNYYNKLKKELENEIELILICCGSEGVATENIANENGFIYIEHPNFPLSQKANMLYLKAQEYAPDACLKIDSDSIISIEFFRYYNDLIKNDYDYSGIEDIYFLTRDYACYWSGYDNHRKGETIGVGRFLSNNLLNQLNWKPWGEIEINRKLDSTLTNNINKLDKSKLSFTKVRCDDIGGMCIDLKSDIGISNIDDYIYDEITTINDIKTDIDFSTILSYLLPYDINKLKIKNK